jgi:hypothetical protein
VAPALGSDLSGDDQVWKWGPPTTLAQACLGNGREHLHAVRLLFETGELFPSVTATVARTALISGSTAEWMLAPEDATLRRQRMLSFAWEDYRQHLAFTTDILRSFHRDDIRPDSPRLYVRRLQERRDELRDVLDTLGGRSSST